MPASIFFGSIIIALGLYLGISSLQQGNAKEDTGMADSLNIDQKLENKAPDQLLALTDDDHIYGNPDANISLIEYSDFECPFCQRFHPTPETIVNEYDGEVNWVYRHYPLSFHNPAATLEAEASECAGEQGGNDFFWKYAKLIYDKTPGNGRGIDKSDLVAMAGELNLNEDTFEECLNSGKFRDRINRDFQNGSLLGVTGTPATFIVNHETGEYASIKGAQSIDTVKAAIEQLL